MAEPSANDGLRGDSTAREWPGVALARYVGRHGEQTEWDPIDFLICESCGSQHAVQYLDCNAFRSPTSERCRAVLGEVYRCARPRGHLGRHEAHAHGERVTWEPIDNGEPLDQFAPRDGRSASDG